jgi:AraC-like DNA-binding protein
MDTDPDRTETDELPLSRHVVFRSTELTETRRHFTDELAPHGLDFATDDHSLNARLHAVRLPRITSMYISYGGSVLSTMDSDAPYFLVQAPVAGRVVVSGEQHQFASTPDLALVSSPAEPVAMRWERDGAAMAFRIDRTALEGELVDLINAPVRHPLRFQARMDVARGAGRSWLATARHFAAELDAGSDMVHHPLVASQVERVLIRGLLVSQPHTYTSHLGSAASRHRPRYVEAVVELIDARPERVWTATELAQQVGVSLRVLQARFRQHLGVSPLQYVRTVRLRRVREELLTAAVEDGITVATVAHRYGVTHLGRFSQDYRARYGESPSQTLRVH